MWADIASITWRIANMSGGYVKHQEGEGEHQLVVFTFIGKLDRELVAEWNESLAALKRKFGHHLVGVTLRGDTTIHEFLLKQRPQPTEP
jgi:hypothetical protein